MDDARHHFGIHGKCRRVPHALSEVEVEALSGRPSPAEIPGEPREPPGPGLVGWVVTNSSELI